MVYRKPLNTEFGTQLGRREFLAASGGLLASAAFAADARATESVPKQPNIVLLIIDTLRANALGAYGATAGASPELDALADAGVQFQQVTSCASWTLPAVGAIVTGRYPRSLGLFQSTDYLQDIAPSIAQQLKATGYKTYGITANAMINSIAGFNRGFDHYQDAKIDWKSAGMRTVRSDVVYRDALRLVEGKDDSPAYLQINIMETHEYYRGEGCLTRPEFQDLFPSITQDASRRHYFQALRQASLDTKKFIDDLREKPGWANTIFVIMGDHGEGLNDHPRVWDSSGHGKLLYRTNVRVPLIWYYPGGNFVPAKCYIPSTLLDIAPTIIDLAGAKPVAPVDGISLTPILFGGEIPADRPAIIAETYGTGIEKIACHSSHWCYVHNRDFHAGCSEFELQHAGAFTDGKHTNAAKRYPDIAFRLNNFIDQWEATHPRRAPVKVSEVSDPGLRKKELEALGYL